MVQREPGDFDLHAAKAPDNLPQWLPYLALRETLGRYMRTVIRNAVDHSAGGDPTSVTAKLHEVYDVAVGQWNYQGTLDPKKP